MAGTTEIEKGKKKRVIVSVGDMGVSNDASATLSTYALGTCIGVVAFHPVVKVGGLLHCMLPDSHLSPGKASTRPCMFVDTGMKTMMELLKEYSLEIKELKVAILGGASMLAKDDHFKIGERNINAIKTQMKGYGLEAKIEELGGNNNRTVHFELGTGELTIKTMIGTKTMLLK